MARAGPADHTRGQRGPLGARAENYIHNHPDHLVLGALLLLAFAVRIASLGSVPGSVTADEADNLQIVYHIRAGQGMPGFFGLDWKPAPAFSVYLMTGFMYVFGWSIAGMRMASAILTTLALIPFYAVARQLVSVRAALVAAFLLSTSLWFLHFSRSGWENAQIGLFSMVAAWAVLRALRATSLTRALGFWAFGGVACALGLYGYFSGRAILAAVLAFLPFALASNRAAWRRIVLGYAVLLVLCLALFAPEIPAIAKDWDYSTSRIRSVAITSVNLPYLGANSMPGVLLAQVDRTIRAFLLADGTVINNARYYPIGRSIFDPLTALLFVLGLGTALARWRKTALWWCLTLVPLGVTQIFSQGTPDLARAVGVVPTLYLFVALGFDKLAGQPGSTWRVVQLGALLFVPFAAYTNISGYYQWMAKPETVATRQPSVDNADFDTWQSLQYADALAGRLGFNAGQWQDIRKKLGPSPSAEAAAAQPRPGPAQTPPGAKPVPAAANANPTTDAADFVASFGADGLFQEPRGVAVDSAGNLYVVDVGSHQVIVLDATGKEIRRWGGEGTDDGLFSIPWDVATDAQDRVYVLDADAQTVQRFDSQGKFQAKFLEKAGLYRPRGLTVDALGNVYVADTGRNRVVKMTPDGSVAAIFGAEGGDYKLDQPTDVAVDIDGSIYVVEPAGQRIHKLSADGKLLGDWAFSPADTLNAPHLAASGYSIFATDPHLQQVAIFGPSGGPTGVFGSAGSGDGQFDTPVGIAADSAGNVYVVDLRNARIVKFHTKG